MEHIHLISDTEVKDLRSVLGRSVPTLYTRSVEVREQIIVASDFSLELGERKYCVIESDWSDTPQEGIDYHMIQVFLRDWPKGIVRVRDQTSPDDMLGYPSSIDLRPSATEPEISRIQVLEHRESIGTESVHYDQAVIFTRSDGYRFALSAQDSIIGGLEFSAHEPLIEDLFKEYPERLCLEH